MEKFVRSLITEWRKLKLPFVGETIIVAVSGGADSMSLLLAIHDLVTRKKITHRVIAAHMNHNLRGKDSDADERFVVREAKRLGFECEVGSVHIAKRGNLEQAAREARYKFFSKVARKNNAFAVLVAHTQNDQAETLLMNLIRGSGPQGLAGMRSVRELESDILLVRPVLSWATRSDTEEFCVQNNVRYRTDRMNADEKYSRVRIRRSILPRLAEINPKIVQTLARTAELMPQSVESEFAHDNFWNLPKLSIKDLKTLESPAMYSTLRSWLKTKRGNLRSLELKHIEAIGRLVMSRKSGNTVELPGGGRVVKQDGSLSFTNIKVEK